jgi:hypothetical protein
MQIDISRKYGAVSGDRCFTCNIIFGEAIFFHAVILRMVEEKKGQERKRQ